MVGSVCSLISVRMRNVLAHTDSCVVLGPRLNLVLGPNGSGKSSFVAALALGLHDNHKMLSKSSELDDFIKHGATTAMITITLRDEDSATGTTVVERTIVRGGVGNRWTWGGEEVRSGAVVRQRLRDSMGIDVDSLCQFLPQERIREFTTLSSQELLRQTERALDERLDREHGQLIVLRSNMLEAWEKAKARRDEVARALAEMTRYQTEQEKLERQGAALRRGKEVQGARRRVEMLRLLASFAAEKAKERPIEEEMKRRAEEEALWDGELRSWATRREEAQARAEEAHQAAEAARRRVSDAAESAHELQLRMAQTQVELGNVNKELAHAREHLESQASKVRALRRELEGLEQPETVRQRREAAEAKVQACKAAARAADEAVGAAARGVEDAEQAKSEAEAALAAARTARDARLRALEASGEGLALAAAAFARLLQSKPEEARRLRLDRDSVRGPLVNEVAVSAEVLARSAPAERRGDVEALAYRAVALLLSKRQKLTFVCTKEESVARAAEFSVRLPGSGRAQGVSAMALDGSAESVARAGHASLLAPEVREAVREMGFRWSLDELLECEAPVREALRVLARSHVAFLSLDPGALERLTRAFPQASRRLPPGVTFITPEWAMQTRESRAEGTRYEHRAMQRAGASHGADEWLQRIPPLRALTERAAALDAREAALGAAQTAEDVARKRRQDAQTDLASAKALLTSLADARRAREDLERRLQLEGLELQRLQERASADVRKERGRVAGKMRQISDALLAHVQEVATHLAPALARARADAAEHAAAAAAAERLALVSKQNRDRMRDAVRSCRDSLRALRDSVSELRRRANDAEARARESGCPDEDSLLELAERHGLFLPGHSRASTAACSDPAKAVTHFVSDAAFDAKVHQYAQEAKDLVAALQIHRDPEELARLAADARAKYQSAVREADAATLGCERGKALLLQRATRWVAEMSFYCRRLDARMRAFFAKLDIDARVKLSSAEDAPPPAVAVPLTDRDFAKYGVTVEVAFRRGDLVPLHSQRHSGGERAVTTMLYLLSLQRSARAPFRCVDEMNQGMDAKNERFIFNEIMEVCGGEADDHDDEDGEEDGDEEADEGARGGGSDGAAANGDAATRRRRKLPVGRQYIIVTPKLLPDLAFRDHCRVHFILNGTHVAHPRALILNPALARPVPLAVTGLTPAAAAAGVKREPEEDHAAETRDARRRRREEEDE